MTGVSLSRFQAQAGHHRSGEPMVTVARAQRGQAEVGTAGAAVTAVDHAGRRHTPATPAVASGKRSVQHHDGLTPGGGPAALTVVIEIPLCIVDAFTDRPFAGNPAGVVLLDGDRWPDEEWMRQVARELNLSETAFAHPLPGHDHADWALRWFTPVVEDDLCGHATLATAHALAAAGRLDTPGVVRFATRSGVLPVHLARDGAITLDFPAATVDDVVAPPGLSGALGVAVGQTHGTGALRDLLVVLPDESTVRGLRPDLGALAEVTRREHLRGITVTAPAEPGRGYDFVSRFFSPADGIPEDPVTGSTHTALAPYWAHRLGRDELTGLQASRRTGLVRAALRHDRVHLTGYAVTVVRGALLVTPPDLPLAARRGPDSTGS
jgi:PhzF family phenazine biosynthesis protein